MKKKPLKKSISRKTKTEKKFSLISQGMDQVALEPVPLEHVLIQTSSEARNDAPMNVQFNAPIEKDPMRVCSLTKLKTLTSSIHLNKELDPLCHLIVIDWPFYGRLNAAFAPLFNIKTLWRSLHDFDIVHIQYDIAGYMPFFLPMIWLLSRLLPAHRRAKIVLTLHEKYDNVPLASLVIAFHNLWYRLADALLVHTKEHKEFLPKSLRHRTFVIPHGVIEAKNVTHDFGANTILFAGYVNAWKGHDVAVKAMPLILRDVPDAKLLFLARSNDLAYEKKVKQMIQDMRMQNRVEWNGKRIEEWEMFSYFDKAAVSLLPYRRITMSGILSHTLSRGVPSVMTDLPAFIEVTKGKALYFRNGDYRDLAYKIIRLLKDKGMQQQMSKEFLELTKEYAWSKMAGRTFDVYRELMQVDA